MATILYTNGTSKEVQPANGKSFTTEELRAVVGRPLSQVPLPDGRIMTLNDEGLPDLMAGIKGLPRNEQATLLYYGNPHGKSDHAAYYVDTKTGERVKGLGPVQPLFIPGDVLVSTKKEAGWME